MRHSYPSESGPADCVNLSLASFTYQPGQMVRRLVGLQHPCQVKADVWSAGMTLFQLLTGWEAQPNQLSSGLQLAGRAQADGPPDEPGSGRAWRPAVKLDA